MPPNSYDIYRDLLIAAGKDTAVSEFRKAYRCVRRPVILGGLPAPAHEHAKLRAATEALKTMKLHTQRWENARDVDYKLIREREER